MSARIKQPKGVELRKIYDAAEGRMFYEVESGASSKHRFSSYDDAMAEFQYRLKQQRGKRH